MCSLSPARFSSLCSYLNSVLPLGEVNLPLALLLGNAGALVLGHAAAHVAGELWAEVERKVLLVLVEQAQLGALVGVDDGQDASDGLAEVVAVNSSVLSFLSLCEIPPRCSRFLVGSVQLGFPERYMGFQVRTFSGSSKRHHR